MKTQTILINKLCNHVIIYLPYEQKRCSSAREQCFNLVHHAEERNGIVYAFPLILGDISDISVKERQFIMVMDSYLEIDRHVFVT